jgi:drug/metabolite transporter (DMT)-like permease
MKSASIAEPIAVAAYPSLRSAAWQGALWKMLGCLFFALINVMIRGMTGGAESAWIPLTPLSSSQLAFVQNFFGSLIMLPLVWGSGKLSFKTAFPVSHSVRIILAVIGLICWYSALRYMSLNYAVTLSFLAPVFTVIGSRYFLGEAFTPLRVIAVTCSIAGSFVLTRPDLALREGTGLLVDLGWAAVLPMISALAWAGHKVVSSMLAKKGESATQMTLFLLLFMAPVTLIPALYDWQPLEPSYIFALLLIAVLAIAAHMAWARAFALADVTYLTPFGFARLFFSSVLSYWLFAELPALGEGFALGASLILVSLLVLAKDSTVSQV